MSDNMKKSLLFMGMALLLVGEGLFVSWNSALGIINFGLISALLALGVNLQWGFAGLFNVGVVGFVALGGLAVVLTSTPPVAEAWTAGGFRIIAALLLGAVTIAAAVLAYGRLTGRLRGLALLAILLGGFFLYRAVLDPGVMAVEAINPAVTGNIGGLGLPVLFAWPIGGLLAAGAAWLVGKTALGLRSDYLAIATLGIGEIIVAVMKNEDWLARGVKNVVGLPRPVPYEVDLQQSESFIARADALGLDPVTASTLAVKLGYTCLFATVLILLLIAAQRALHSPWGRMMRAIRDNEVAAEAMGKNVTRRHLQIFVLGSAICGIAGAMMTTLDGQLTPGSYQPLRYTFLIWVMVIVGGSGNNLGAVLGGFLIYYLYTKVEAWGPDLMVLITSGMAEDSALRLHLIDSAAHMRLLTMGVILLLVLRFSPRGLIPEK
ncbi:MAG: branched-chain amino acid ABC transporter permease [Rhodobacterales bacterium]|nr:MAG: branched-chain amino acid ABC transporter permease [Rhodobacterales bacterium]